MTRIAFATALCLAACVQAGQADETTLAPDASKIDWQLVEVDGQAPEWTATINLGETGRITGQAPCNRFFGNLTRDGSRFAVSDIGATRMACLRMEGEAQFFQILEGVATAEQTPGQLILAGNGHEMRFVQPID